MQFNTINTFKYINLDKAIFIYIFLEYSKNDKVIYLNQMFYN